MLDLTRGRPAAVAVALGGGAVAMVRPATALEVDRAAADVRAQLAGLAAAEDDAEIVAAALGEEFHAADFSDPHWQAAAAQRLALLALAVLCIESWTGIGVDGETVEPSRATIALLLRDPLVSQRIRNAIEAQVHSERAEGNESRVSPTGAGEAAVSTAPPAIARTLPVH